VHSLSSREESIATIPEEPARTTELHSSNDGTPTAAMALARAPSLLIAQLNI
jgi:hypothetical protein